MPSHSYWFHQSMIIYADMRVLSINHCRNIRTFVKSDVVALSDYQYRIHAENDVSYCVQCRPISGNFVVSLYIHFTFDI